MLKGETIIKTLVNILVFRNKILWEKFAVFYVTIQDVLPNKYSQNIKTPLQQVSCFKSIKYIL